MLAELCGRIWQNGQFQSERRNLLLTGLRDTLAIEGNDIHGGPSQGLLDCAPRLLESACHLAMSPDELQRIASYEIAASAWKLWHDVPPAAPFDKALLVNCVSLVFTRLGNFPAEQFLRTRVPDVQFPSGARSLWFAEESHREDNAVEVFPGQPIVLTDFQRELWTALSAGGAVVVNAPTSAGKSFVLQNFLASLFAQRCIDCAVYLVPTRALIAQVMGDVSSTFSRLNRNVLLTEVPASPGDDSVDGVFYILTQERLQILLDQASPPIDFMVVDEAQSIADQARGVVLQSVVERVQRGSPGVRIVFGSPFTGNPEVFPETFGIPQENVRVLNTRESPVSQNLIHIATSPSVSSRITIQTIAAGEPADPLVEMDLGTEMSDDRHTLAHIAWRFGRPGQSIVYGCEPVKCEKIGLLLAGLSQAERGPGPIDEVLAEFASMVRQHIHNDFSLAYLVENGVAFHYGNLPTFIRKGIQELLSEGRLSFVVCTSTLLQGVNLPARNIFVQHPSKGREGGAPIPLVATEFWNLVGRAGRLTKDFEGNVYLIDLPKWQTNPLRGPRERSISPSFRGYLCDRTDDLLAFIRDEAHPSGDANTMGLENSFMKLFNDYQSGVLPETLRRYSPSLSAGSQAALIDNISRISQEIAVPPEIAHRNPNVSVYRQQQMLDYLVTKIQAGQAEHLIPPHPLRSGAYTPYLRLFKRIHNHFERKPKADRSHTYFAALALNWMKGRSYAELLAGRIKRSAESRQRGSPGVNAEARALFSDIEDHLRFRYVKFTRCYLDLLVYALGHHDLSPLCERIPPVYLFLELGASSHTMMSFIGLGVSRTASALLAEVAPRSDMHRGDASAWLRSANLAAFDLPLTVTREVNRLFT